MVTAKNGDKIENFYVVSVNGSTVKLITDLRVNPGTLEQSSSASNVKFQTSYVSGDKNAYWSGDAAGRYPYDLTGKTVSEAESGEKVALYTAQQYGKKFGGATGSLLTKYELDDLLGRTRSNGNSGMQAMIQSVSWLYRSSWRWWLGSAGTMDLVWRVDSNGTLFCRPTATRATRMGSVQF